MKTIILTFFLFHPIMMVASPYNIATTTTIENGNWYPLTEKEMKAAAIDTALAELTSAGLYSLDEATDRERDGRLHNELTLIGNAHIVKLTMKLDISDKVSFVSTVSMDITNLDYQGIYKAFEYVGGEAAKQLNARVSLFESTSKVNNKGLDKQLLVDFNRAQELKRQMKILQARALFEKVSDSNQTVNRELSAMAADELKYSLPMFEAQNLLLQQSMQPPDVIKQNMERVGYIYRQVLADNMDDPQRIIEVQRLLDQLQISNNALARMVQAAVMNLAAPIKIALMEYYAMEGRWPDKDAFEELLSSMLWGARGQYDLVNHELDGKLLRVVVKVKKYNTDVAIRTDEFGGIQIEAR